MGEQPVVPLAPRQPFWGLVVFAFSVVGGGGRGVGGGDGLGMKKEREEEEMKGGGRVEGVMVSFPHMNKTREEE